MRETQINLLGNSVTGHIIIHVHQTGTLSKNNFRVDSCVSTVIYTLNMLTTAHPEQIKLDRLNNMYAKKQKKKILLGWIHVHIMAYYVYFT